MVTSTATTPETATREHESPERFKTLPHQQKGTHERGGLEVVSKSEHAKASSAHSRINIPLNLANWKGQPEAVQAELLWLHQWILDNGVSWKDATEALGKDQSTLFRLLKGTYQAKDWGPIVSGITSFRQLQEKRATIQQSEFRPNGISELIFAGLDYAVANNSITLIEGESRMGKSVAVEDWKARNNHGRSVLIEVPPIGGPKGLLLEIAKAVGVNRNLATPQLLESVVRAFNRNRILIVDEAHRTIPSNRNATPIALEVVRYIHGKTKAAIALISTRRMSEAMKGSHFQYEQVIGRIGMPISLQPEITAADILPIVTQFLETPGAPLLARLVEMANQPGRLGMVVETLKVASRIARKSSKSAILADQHVTDAIAMRTQMMGGLLK